MTVLYEDNHIIIVSKEPGEIVQGDKTGDVPLSDMVKQYIKERYAKPGAVFLGVVHRLDRPVSGIVVFARTSKALSRLNQMFASHEAVKKTYWALAPLAPTMSAVPSPTLDPLRLEHWLTRNEKQNKAYAYPIDGMTADQAQQRGAKRASLDVRSLAEGDRYQLLEVQLHTGRHHQIRCQLAAIGLPIKGDLKYGAPRSNPDGSISLHARSIEFEHPVSHKSILITAPCPLDPLWHILEQKVAK